MTTLGKYRHLTQASTPAGHFVMLAIDHRDVLRDALNRAAPSPISDAQFAAFKRDIMQHLLPACSAVLADPGYGFGPGIADGTIGGAVGVLAPLEDASYTTDPHRYRPAFMPRWSVARIKRFGGAGVKLLVYYHPEAPTAAAVRDAVSRAVEECARYDLPLYLEPLSFSPDPARPLPSAERRPVGVEAARTFCALGIDVLKAEFPVNVRQEPDEDIWRAALAELDAACTVPWALLSAGVDYSTFLRQTELACQAGASGVIVGRAVWAEAVSLGGEERARFLETRGQERMRALAAICAQHGADWRKRVAPPETTAPDWYFGYKEFGD